MLKLITKHDSFHNLHNVHVHVRQQTRNMSEVLGYMLANFYLLKFYIPVKFEHLVSYTATDYIVLTTQECIYWDIYIFDI